MNAPVTPVPVAPKKRLIWPWVVGALLSPFVVIAAAAYSYLTLDRDAATLRRHVMAATNADWDTKVQVSVGRLTLGTVGTGLRFIDDVRRKPEVSLALKCVRSASVGVYERRHRGSPWVRDAAKLMNETDAAMTRKGWTRLVGVCEKDDTVLVYVPQGADEPDEICVAVVNSREMVVVSATLSPHNIGRLVEQVAGDKLRLTHLKHYALR